MATINTNTISMNAANTEDNKRKHRLVAGEATSQQRTRRARIMRQTSKGESDECSSLAVDTTTTTNTTMDEVAAMNEVGIANLYAGDALVAQESFINALGSTSSKAKVSLFSASNNTTKVSTSTSKAFSSPQLNLSTTEASTSTSSTSTATTSTSNMHVYQREEYDEGMHVYKEALYLNKEASKPIRDATLMYNVGQTHLRTRQYNDAKRWFSMALTTYEASTQASDSLLNDVKIHHNLAFCHYCLGDNERAMSHYQTAFRRLQILGLGDLDIAACCNSIGILHLCRGSIADSDKAMECLQLSLNIYKRILGGQSSQVATCLSNIARVFFSRQEFETALTLFQEALKIREASTPASKVDEAAAMFNIGQTFQKLNQVEAALEHFKKFRQLAEPTLGKNHRDIATCIKAMACIYYEAGKLEQACALLEEAVLCSRDHSSENPMELACLLRDMGCLYSMTQQPEKALKCHLETLELQKQQLTEESDANTNPNIMVTLLHIAQNQKKLGKYTQALNVYRTVYGIQLEAFGPKSLEVAATLCSIGLMLYLKQELQSSLNYYQEALRVRQEHFKTNNNFDIAATFNSIGLIAFKMNKLDLAKNAFRECIRIRIQLEATDAHRDIVTLYSNLGTVYLASGEDKEAIQMFAESIRLERLTLGDNHLGVAVSLQHLAQLHQDRGELELAHDYFKEALQITRGVDESMMANKQRTICTLLNLMGNIHLMKAEVPQMMECFAEASRVSGDNNAQDLVIAGYTFYGISKMHPPAAPIA